MTAQTPKSSDCAVATPTQKLLRIAVPVPLAELFDYRWESDAPPPAPGCRVTVPFGRGSRIGIVMATASTSALPAERIKPIREVLDTEPLLQTELLETLCWAAAYYHHPIGEVVRHALPGLLRKGATALEIPAPRWYLTPAGSAIDQRALARRAPRQADVLALLATSGAQTSVALRDAGLTAAVCASVAAKGWIEACPPETEAIVPAFSGAASALCTTAIPDLTAAQQAALDAITTHRGGFCTFLLHGVTGSGKTEVFLRLVDRELRAGRQTLLLVPEIGLTPQLVTRLQGRFGEHLVTMHSGLNERERLTAWQRACAGRAGIVVGTRSAVFAELPHLGLIIVDEEHDASYKQQQGFRYSARDLAIVRARRRAIPVLLATATPSFETLRNVREGRYHRLSLPHRIGSAGHPRIEVIDLTHHAAHHGLSAPLAAAIQTHLANGNQVMLFLNRRGFAPALLCTNCGKVEQCTRCDARMTIHARAGELRCHHCGATHRLTWACPHCGTERIAVGAGTQRVADELCARYPGYAIARLDRDATARKGALDAVLESVRSGETQILVGTQMLTKGHDFPRVTLVGVLGTDQGLFGTEVRSEERLAQMLVQVAGRAGRGSAKGEVMIQTHYPEHPLLKRLFAEGYTAFADAALEERARAGWPPYSHVTLVRAEGHRPELALAFLAKLKRHGEHTGTAVRLLGPTADPLERKAGWYRARLLLQATTRAPLHALIDVLLGLARTSPEARRLRWSIDVDPLDV